MQSQNYAMFSRKSTSYIKKHERLSSRGAVLNINIALRLGIYCHKLYTFANVLLLGCKLRKAYFSMANFYDNKDHCLSRKFLHCI